MSFINPEYDALVRDFSPGFLDTPATDSLPYGACIDGRNTFFGRIQRDANGTRATIMKRAGCRLVNPVPVVALTPFDAIDEFSRIGATNELIVAIGGTLYKWDGATDFTAITGGSGLTAGHDAQTVVYQNQLYVFDGTVQKRYNGTACFPVGFIAPTGAPTLTVGSATGVTGNYEGFAVWYDSLTDHESSPGPMSAVVTFADQKRTWAKPTGAPPSNVDFWRVYARRVDTNEILWYRVATVAIGTASVTESVSDTLRRDVGPGPSVNDPPPAFAFVGTWKGYVFGFPEARTTFYVSKQGDAESWHPKDQLTVKAAGRDVRASKNYGTEFLVFSPNRTYHLIGDAMPFLPEEIHSEFGLVNHDAGQEIAGYFYGWDEQKGPYRTNLAEWQQLADNRIASFVNSVNRSALDKVKCCHAPKQHLVMWAVPTTSIRQRTILAYDYELDVWLPPITGLEFSQLTTFTTSAGALGVYMGDYWGRVYELFTGTTDGPPGGTLVGTVTGGTTNTVTASAATWYTTGAGLVGMVVAVKSPAGVYQFRRILSNTATTITLDTTYDSPWTTVPAAGWTVYVGPIDWYWSTPWIDYGDPDGQKRGHWLTLQGATGSPQTLIEVSAGFNDESAWPYSRQYPAGAGGGSSLWGQMVWGVSLWGSAAGQRKPRKNRIGRAFYSVRFRFRNMVPGEIVQIYSFHTSADRIMRRRAIGLAS